MRRLPVLALAALVLAACGGRSENGRASQPGAGCGPDIEEPLDPGSAQHLLPGAPEPKYARLPPTSGPHSGTPPPPPQGVQREPLPGPVQVAVLERGGVLLQHRDIAADDRARLEALAGPLVVVAPQPSLPSAVVATAWRHRLECRRLDMAALEAFIARHRGRGPGAD